MSLKKILIAVIASVLLTSLVPAQSSDVTFDSSVVSSEKSWSDAKHPFVALGGAMGFNLILATWNRYMIGSGWAKTGPDEWFHFWERDMSWDRDWYWTNYFLHPYQGSMYYMSARGSNLNQLESMGITVLGSAFWEWFCETNEPSKNDMIYTTIGSFCVGEMFFRLSQESNEVSRLLGIALNPQRMWTEYVCGVKQKNTHSNIHSLSLGLSAGNVIAGTELKDVDNELYEQQETYPAFGMFELNVDYNDPYTHDSNDPYSQFSLYVQGGLGKGSGTAGLCAYEDVDEKLFYDIRIFSDAMLFARTFNAGENKDTSAGLTMIYDFEWHSYYMLSSLAPGVAIKQRINGDESVTEWQAQLGGIILGTTDYYYYHRRMGVPEGTIRSYSNNTGAEALLKFKYKKENGSCFDLNFRGYAMYDFYGQIQTGNESTGWEYVGLVTAGFEVPVSKKVNLGLKDELYGKYAFYRKVPDVKQLVNTAKVYAKIDLK